MCIPFSGDSQSFFIYLVLAGREHLQVHFRKVMKSWNKQAHSLFVRFIWSKNKNRERKFVEVDREKRIRKELSDNETEILGYLLLKTYLRKKFRVFLLKCSN